MPLLSSGGIAIIQMLNIIENYDLKNYSHNSLDYIKLLTKVMSFAYADRSEYLGDEDFAIAKRKINFKNMLPKSLQKLNGRKITFEPVFIFMKAIKPHIFQ